jgi:hypothetical protein
MSQAPQHVSRTVRGIDELRWRQPDLENLQRSTMRRVVGIRGSRLRNGEGSLVDGL